MTRATWPQRVLRGAVASVLLTMAALPAGAQPRLHMRLGHGTVTVDAVDMPVQAVLDEWARLGSVTIANAEVLPADRTVSLSLADAPEGRLLEALLGGVAGYLATLRPAGATAASSYDKIWLVEHPSTEALSRPRRELTTVDMTPVATRVATEELQDVPTSPAASAPTEELTTLPPSDAEVAQPAAERRERVAPDTPPATAPAAPERPTLRERPTP